MTPDLDYQLKSAFLSTKEDHELFYLMTDHLARRDNDPSLPYHSGPHTLSKLRDCFKLVLPRRVLEIGFNLGHSASMWLELGVQEVVSIDPIAHLKRTQSVDAMMSKYHERFIFIPSHSGDYDLKAFLDAANPFDLIFIDGSHDFKDVWRDIGLALDLGIPNILCDDFDPHHGPGVVASVASHNLVLRALFGTMQLCRPPEGYIRRADRY